MLRVLAQKGAAIYDIKSELALLGIYFNFTGVCFKIDKLYCGNNFK